MPSDTAYVAVVGAAAMDIHGKPYRSLNHADSNPGSVVMVPGGVARNVAENLARMDVAAKLISVVGDDEHGRTLLELGRAAGIDMSLVQTQAGCSTASYLAILDSRGEMHLAVADTDIVERLDVQLLASCRTVIERAALVAVDTNLSAAALAWLVATAGESGLFVDTVSAAKAARIKPCLGAVHTLKTNRIEAAALSGIDGQNDDALGEIADWCHAHGVVRVFITLGGRGAFFSAAGTQGILGLDTSDVPIENSGGAGDAFFAGLIVAWLEGLALEASVQFALAAAAVTLAYPGTNDPGLSRTSITARLSD